MTQESEAPIKLPAPSVVKALFVASNALKEDLSARSGAFGDRVKTQIEVGNLHGPAFRQAAAIFRKARNNELNAKEHLAHLRAYLDWVEEDLVNKGHTGNLDDMAREGDDAAEQPAETAAQAAERIFSEQNRAAAGEALDIDALKPAAEKSKGKGGRKKTVEAQAEEAPAAPVDDDVPAAPSDEIDEDAKPPFLRRGAEPAEEQGGTFSRVH